MKKIILIIPILLVLVSACKKNENKKDPADYTREDFVSAYTFQYTHHRVLKNPNTQEITTDTTYSGTRTIFIELISGDPNFTENHISLRNLYGEGDSDWAVISGNSYILDGTNYFNGEGKLINDELSIDINRSGTGIVTDKLTGTAIKN